MGEFGDGPDFSEEPLGTQRLDQTGVQNLDGDPSVVSQVLGQEYRGHPPAANLALDAVAIGQCRRKLRLQFTV